MYSTKIIAILKQNKVPLIVGALLINPALNMILEVF
jgi:hypothetical protein